MDILKVLYNFNISIYLSLLFQDLHTNYITHMGKIATEQEVYNVGGKGTPITNKCCTKSRAETLGCKIKSGYSYKDNQLIEQGSYEKDITLYKGVMLSVSFGTPPTILYPFQYMTWPSSRGYASLTWPMRGNVSSDYYYGVIVNSEDDGIYVNVGGTGETALENGNLCEIGYYAGGNNSWTRQSKSLITFTSEIF